MWIKICGNTNLEDAKLAAELGADAVGFIFAASKRRMTAAQVAVIARELPENVERVGVFDSHDAEEIVRIAQEAKLNAVQLHGGFDEPLLNALAPMLAGAGIRIIQTLHLRAHDETHSPNERLSQRLKPLVAEAVEFKMLGRQLERIAALGFTDRILIDSKVGDSPGGGTGVAFDWSAAHSLFASAPKGLRLIVAGGLRSENVADAIRELQPWGVDVSSGVEASIGRKDPAKLARFIRNARGISAPDSSVRST
jgi:phosphoribosylanthranilate isomerase